MKIGNKIAALLVGAAIMAAPTAIAFAESVPQTVVVEQQLGASATKTWDGKSALKAGQNYVLKKSVTLSKKVEIPKGTTLTLNKGVKLGISAKGSLYIRGTLAMKSGSTLSVSGKLYTYSGSKISDTGAIKLNTNKATVTIGGTLAVNKGGTISGTPKSIKLGKNAKVTIKGTNSCKKLAALLGADSELEKDKKAIAEKITAIEETVLLRGDLYGAMEMAYPEAVLKRTEEEFKAMMAELDETGEYADMTVKDFYNQLYTGLLKPMIDQAGTIKSVKATVVKLTDCLNSLSDEEKAFFADCGTITKAYIAELKSDVDMDVNPGKEDYIVLDESMEIRVVNIGGEWYFSGEVSSLV